MKKNRGLIITVLAILVLALCVSAVWLVWSSLSKPAPAPAPAVPTLAQATASPTNAPASPVPTSKVEVTVVGTVGPSIAEATPAPTTTEQPEPEYGYGDLPECVNPDESTPLAGATQRADGLWEINLHGNGCNLVFEGRIVPGERLHRVIVLRSGNGEIAGYIQNGVFTYSEGSIWQKPRTKNMEDVANLNDPAEALKLLNDKRAVMDANGYDWPIWLYFTDGTTLEFGPGQTWEGLTSQNHCDLQEPVKINVHGEKLEGKNQFSAAIGATNCITVAWIDGATTPVQWAGQRDAANKVIYTIINAWLMPAFWDQSQIDAWIAEQ